MHIPESPRIVLDTNLWVGYFLGQHVHVRLDRILYDEKFSILMSDALFDEVVGVLNRPKFARFFSLDDVRALLDALSLRSELIDVASSIALSRDPNDDFLLSLCLDGSADFLLTGDNDLLILHPFGHTQIVKLADFSALYGF